MTNPDYTAVLFIIDRSGSMYAIRDEMEGGINGVLEEQKKLDGKVTIDVAYFDDEISYEDKFLSLDEADIKIMPRNMTALHDAIVSATTTFGTALAALSEDERPGNVLIIIVTDGHENASKEAKLVDVKSVITEQQDTYGWDFLFLGANQDAIETGDAFGLRAGSSMTYSADSAGVSNVSATIGLQMTRSRSGL